MDHPRAWIFTSPTLAVGEDFRHFTRELGVPEAETRRWASPFDFAHQALLYVPRGLPLDPNDPAFTQAVIEAALPVLEASGGRAFLLFTTLRALRRAHELLRSRIGFPLLVQGTGSRSELLSRFRTLGNAVLLRSLPPMKLTRRLADVEGFFRDYQSGSQIRHQGALLRRPSGLR